MKIRAKQFGLSLVETIVVVAVVALMIGLAIPAVKTFMNPTTSSAGVESMISAALSSARAIAAKNQKYAGIRFQQDKNGNQYMIAIINDSDATGLAYGFTAVKGLSPVKLPESVLILSTKYRTEVTDANNADVNDIKSSLNYSKNTRDFNDISTFSVIFSPSGNFVIHAARIRNKDGEKNGSTASEDSVFNTQKNVMAISNPCGQFIQDDYASDGYGAEIDVNRFIIINKKEFYTIDEADRWTDYLEDPANAGQPDPAKTFYINQYSGSIINEK